MPVGQTCDVGMRQFGLAVASLVLAVCAACGSTPEARQHWVTWATTSGCLDSARSAGVTAHVAVASGAGIRLMSVEFYPKGRYYPDWGFRFEYRDFQRPNFADAGYFEELADPWRQPSPACTAAGISVTSPLGRQTCFYPAGGNATVRYFSNGILYQLDFVLPNGKTATSAEQRWLVRLVDTLR